MLTVPILQLTKFNQLQLAHFEMRLEEWEKQNPTASREQWVKLSITETFLFKRGSPERRLWGAKHFAPLLLRNLLILNLVYLIVCTDFQLLDTIPGAFSGTCASELPSTDLAERVFCIDAI